VGFCPTPVGLCPRGLLSYGLLSGYRFGRSWSSKVIDFGTNRRCDCDFLLVRHSNHGPILHLFRRYCRFCADAPPIFHLNLGVFPLHQIAHVGVSSSMNLKLISREIIFEVFQTRSMYSRQLNVTYGRTDGRIDRRHTAA